MKKNIIFLLFYAFTATYTTITGPEVANNPSCWDILINSCFKTTKAINHDEDDIPFNKSPNNPYPETVECTENPLRKKLLAKFPIQPTQVSLSEKLYKDICEN